MTEVTGSYWPQSPGEWRVAMACEANMQRFERLTLDLVTAPGVSADEARETAAGLIRMATERLAPDEPFLQPDYIAAPVVGTPGDPITLMRREGSAR